MPTLFPHLRTTAALLLLLAGGAVHAQPTFSQAEQRLFMDEHLANLPDHAAVSYAYAKTGSLEPAFDDQVRLQVDKTAGARHTHVDYLTAERAFALPDIDAANGNPVILSFLERDVREMERRTGGKAAFFRNRVRMAFAEKAQVEPVTVDVDGRQVQAVRIVIRPYEDDPMQARYGVYAGKIYTITMSKQVPGMLYEMRTEVRDRRAPEAAPPLVVEQLLYTGITP
jgi:hypothetical protein